MNLLCLDYGTKHTGLAMATTFLAEPFQTIDTDQIVRVLPELIKAHHIDQIIIGLPDGPIHNQVLLFTNQLKSTLNIPIIHHDETLSSADAHQKLVHAKHKTKIGPDHHYAAALILQDYLDQTAVNSDP